MKRRTLFVMALVSMLLFASFAVRASAHDDEGKHKGKGLHAKMTGYREVPAISTGATGRFQSMIAPSNTSISYTLTYSGLESNASAAHLHFGQRGVTGGVIAWLCGGGGKPSCPLTSGSVSGTIVAADVMTVAGQGIAAGELAEVIRAMQSKATYANVHTAGFPNGEIRGDVK